MLDVFVPIALKRSSGTLSRDVHSANVPSKDVMAGVSAKSPCGTDFSDEHSANISLTEVVLESVGIRSAGISSNEVQPQNVPEKLVDNEFFAKRPAGRDFREVQLTNVAVNFVFAPATGSNNPSGRASSDVQFSNEYARDDTEVDSGNIEPSIFFNDAQLLNTSSNPVDTAVFFAKRPAGTVSMPEP